jgi:pilus assembly protein Flp/PilA
MASRPPGAESHLAELAPEPLKALELRPDIAISPPRVVHHDHQLSIIGTKERRTMHDFIDALLGLYMPEERQGQGLVEYALIILLVAIVVVAMLTVLGGQLGSMFSRVATSLQG